MLFRHVRCLGLSLVAVVTSSVDAWADYLFARDGSGVHRFADDGTELPSLRSRYPGYEDPPFFNEFIDESIGPVELGSDGMVYTIGNSLGTIRLRRFEPTTGIEAGIVYANPISEWNWLEYGSFSEACPLVSSNCNDLPAYSGRIDYGLAADAFGGIWSFGAIERHFYNDGYLSSSYVYGQGISRYQLGSNGLPVAVAQFSAGDVDEFFQWPEHSFLDLDIRPGTADAFVSTPHGLLEIGRYGVPSQLRPGLFAFQAPINDPANPASPFASFLPWMHPLAVGAGWEFHGDILWKLSDEGGSKALSSYDPDDRVLSDPIVLAELDDSDPVTGYFFDDQDNLLVLTTSERYGGSCDRNGCADEYVTQRLYEVEVPSGLVKRMIFEVERLDTYNGGINVDQGRFYAGLYVRVIPEPSAGLLLTLLLAAVAGRRP